MTRVQGVLEDDPPTHFRIELPAIPSGLIMVMLVRVSLVSTAALCPLKTFVLLPKIMPAYLIQTRINVLASHSIVSS